MNHTPDVLIRPVLTEKAMQKEDEFIFRVRKGASKTQIRAAVEAQFGGLVAMGLTFYFYSSTLSEIGAQTARYEDGLELVRLQLGQNEMVDGVPWPGAVEHAGNTRPLGREIRPVLFELGPLSDPVA